MLALSLLLKPRLSEKPFQVEVSISKWNRLVAAVTVENEGTLDGNDVEKYRDGKDI